MLRYSPGRQRPLQLAVLQEDLGRPTNFPQGRDEDIRVNPADFHTVSLAGLLMCHHRGQRSLGHRNTLLLLPPAAAASSKADLSRSVILILSKSIVPRAWQTELRLWECGSQSCMLIIIILRCQGNEGRK